VMNNRTFVNAQAYYGEPVSGQRQTAVEGAAVQAGGVPFEGDAVVSQPAQVSKGRKVKPKGV
jgi:hypothetical protein